MFCGNSTVPFETFFQLDSNNRTKATRQRSRKTDAELTQGNTFSLNRWNSLKQETIEATDINTFKRFLDKERKTRMDIFMD